jgi:hypothetical protein
MVELIVILFLLSYICVQEWQHSKDRKKFIDSLLAKDLKELKEYEKPAEKSEPLAEKIPNYIPVNEATDEDFEKAILKDLGRADKESLFERAKRKING